MTREEAINILKQYIDYDNTDVPDFYTMEEACEVVIKALEQEPLEVEAANLQKVYNKGFEDCRQAVLDLPRIKTHNVLGNVINESVDVENVRQLPSVTPQPKMGSSSENLNKWIPCSEKLPEIHQDVILSLRNLEIEIGFRAETEPCFYYHGYYIDSQSVLAWMPLPQPYKAESEVKHE